MADEKAFSHITVSADDEDDVVIVAGARPASRASGEVRPAAGAAAAPTPVAAAPEPEPAPTIAPAPDPAPAASPSRQPKEDVSETTLEDLKGEPMPLTQKIVIAVAALLIVSFAVYYFFLR
ncbi:MULTISPECIES: SURF2 Surfeit locus protein 2 [Gordonibacter]|uniref:SURF2 Surfeit locus protein 2 n=1 Tax=Gordonibacter faecis TaxID=3047475 RepID=A0ABT7DNK2_9ACTN|nr:MULTISPECIES: SURF2 Surfeit locus protein 2 [unclassified Gordonibacter]MDJ1651113.1 SURF2 Surfeit locus protein 2 [Gordonibacter sp. KGMB12511]HIW75416.1 SURF2 Surfeit locus protein 2 [Candidatus Gordonibacter avicola]